MKLKFILPLLLIMLNPSHAWAIDNNLAQQIKLAQESFRTNGVLISRPRQLDLQIVDIIQTNRFQNLEDYSQWLQKNVHYLPDQNGEHWASAQETLVKHTGDCEDYTILTSEVAKVLGYRPQFVALFRNGKAHAICAFKYKGYYVWFDNAKLKKSHAQSLEQLGQELVTQYAYSYMMELDQQTKQWQMVYKNS
jgi:hypothetical protein